MKTASVDYIHILHCKPNRKSPHRHPPPTWNSPNRPPSHHHSLGDTKRRFAITHCKQKQKTPLFGRHWHHYAVDYQLGGVLMGFRDT